MTEGDRSGRGCFGCLWSACVVYIALLFVAAGVDWLLNRLNTDPNSLDSFFTWILSGPLGWVIDTPIADVVSPGWVTMPIYVSLIAGLIQVVLVLGLAALLTWLARVSRSRRNER